MRVAAGTSDAETRQTIKQENRLFKYIGTPFREKYGERSCYDTILQTTDAVVKLVRLVSGPLSVVSSQWSVVSGQWSLFGYDSVQLKMFHLFRVGSWIIYLVAKDYSE